MDEPRRTLSDALAYPRYELVPVKGVDEQLDALPVEATVTVMCSPSKGPERTIALCERLAARHVRVLPHLAARVVQSREHLGQLLERLELSGVRGAFVIGGDASTPAGPYASALELLRDMEELGHGLDSIGIAAYPESHPVIEDGALVSALEAKRSSADYMVTQMCFDAAAVVRWLHEVRARGNHLPVHIGMAGPVDITTLTRIAMKIGVRDSGRYLAKHKGQIGKLMQQYCPDDFLSHLEPHLECEVCNIAGFHIYSFNQLARAESWRTELVDGPGARGGLANPAAE